MQENNKNINYTTEDILRYLRGQMSAGEMHALENAALEDPFLQDAIEGIATSVAQYGETATLSGLEELQSAVIESNATAKTRSRVAGWIWWTAAAAVVGLAFLLSLQLFDTDRADKALATTESATMSEPDTPLVTQDVLSQNGASADQADTAKNTENAVPPVQAKRYSRRESEPIASKKALPSTPERRMAAAAPVKAEEVELMAIMPPAKTDTAVADFFSMTSDPMEFDETIVIQDPNLSKLGVDSIRRLPMSVLSGRVVNKNYQPLANAQLNFTTSTGDRHENIRLVTNHEGRFRVRTPDSLLHVSVDKLGYMQQAYRLNRKQPEQNTILMEALPEAASAAPSIAEFAREYNAEPETGWKKFEVYIDQNKKQVDSSVRGVVEVSFRVNADGTRSHFKIEKSLHPSLDADAIRLIREGPAWRVTKGQSALARVSVIY